MSFRFEVATFNEFPIIKLEGNLIERVEAIELLAQVNEYLELGQTSLIIDLKKLDYLNSSGLNVLLNMLTRARNAGGEAVICNVSPKLSKLLVITKLDAVFSLASDQTEAHLILNNKGNSTHEHGT
jgi:anti-sigma B factor antagonist